MNGASGSISAHTLSFSTKQQLGTVQGPTDPFTAASEAAEGRLVRW